MSGAVVPRQSPAPVTPLAGCIEVTPETDHVHPERVAHARSTALPERELTEVTTVFKMLGDPTRARLLYALLEAGELCVCDLAAATGQTETTVSQALRLLRASDVVVGRRQGRLVFYRLADSHVRMLLDLTREHTAHDGGDPRGGH